LSPNVIEHFYSEVLLEGRLCLAASTEDPRCESSPG